MTTDLRSHVTAVLRRAARWLPGDNPVRKGLAAAWDGLLRMTGPYVTIPVAGRLIRLRVAYRHLDPDYEADALRVWLRLIRPGDTVWDVGANFGLYTILTGQMVGPTGAVVAWEPAPGTYDVLRDHIAANRLGGWCQAIQAAVADKNGGTIPFTLLSGDEPNPKNRIARIKSARTVEVPVGTLDEELGRLGRPPRLVKIDIEGAEVLALRGAARLLGPGGSRPILLLAVHPPFLPEFQCSVDDLLPLLERYQYVCHDLAGNPARPTELAEYLLSPKERADEVVAQIRS